MSQPTLPEGYQLLEYDPRSQVALAYNPEYRLGKYVTWKKARDGGVHSGNYFPSIKSAAIDYEIRTGKRPAA